MERKNGSLYISLLHFYFGEISRRNFVVRGLVSWFVVGGSWFVVSSFGSGDPKRGLTQKGGWQPRAAE